MKRDRCDAEPDEGRGNQAGQQHGIAERKRESVRVKDVRVEQV